MLAGSAKQRLLLRVNSSSNGGQSCSVSAKLGWLMIVRIQLGVQKLFIIRSSRVSAIQGLFKY